MAQSLHKRIQTFTICYFNVSSSYFVCLFHQNQSDHHHTPRPHHEIQTHAEVNSTNYEEPADYSAVIHQ